MSPDSTVTGASALLGPLQPVNSESTPENCIFDEKQKLSPSTSQVAITTAILQWSKSQVVAWLQESVPLGHNRMQECVHAFRTKGVDGLCFLTLRRTHQACTGMTDFEWLLFKAARKRLVSGGGKLDPLSVERLGLKYNNFSTSFWTPPCTPRKGELEVIPPASPQPYRQHNNAGLRHAQGALLPTSAGKMFTFPKLLWGSDAAKDEQIEMLVTEVQMLRGEVVSAEERETTLQAQMNHLDDVLKNAVLAEYIYTRTRWIPLVGDPSVDDEDVDNWLQRFLVLEGSSIFFYLHGTDLRPQGTILLDDIVEVGPLPAAQMFNKGSNQRWFLFHITTCHGLRLECTTQSKLQMDSWLTALGADFNAGDSLQQHLDKHVPTHTHLERLEDYSSL